MANQNWLVPRKPMSASNESSSLKELTKCLVLHRAAEELEPVVRRGVGFDVFDGRAAPDRAQGEPVDLFVRGQDGAAVANGHVAEHAELSLSSLLAEAEDVLALQFEIGQAFVDLILAA